MTIDPQIADTHLQVFKNSCIPSSVELVLKLVGKLGVSLHPLQCMWGNWAQGCLHDFDVSKRRTAYSTLALGLTFSVIDELSGNDLISRIEGEISAGRFVIVSLPSGSDWHMWVVFDVTATGWKAVTKNFALTQYSSNVKQEVQELGSTHILVYE